MVQEEFVNDSSLKQAKSGDVVKLEVGEYLEGSYMGYEESKTYPGSYALKIRKGDDTKVTFVNNIAIDLIESNGIKQGDFIRVFFKGMRKNEAGTYSYKEYEIFYK